MNRLQKKCIIASTGLHLLLAVILLVGPAFLSSSSKMDNSPILDIIPANAIEGDTSGGGGPRMRPPAPPTQVSQPPAEPPAQPQPVQQPVVAPQPKPQVVKAPAPEPPKVVVSKPSPEAIEAVKEPKHKIVVNTQLVTADQKSAQDAKDAKRAADRAAKQAADAQKKLAAAFGRATSEIKGSVASGTDIKFNDGFGGTGPAYASWLQIVKSIYYNDWSQRVPDGITDESAVGVASVTITRDGTVLSSRITQTSGSPAVDRSIQTTLDRVRFTHRFPDTSKDDQTTLQIYFSVKALKQLLG